jgi:hypothetical protein
MRESRQGRKQTLGQWLAEGAAGDQRLRAVFVELHAEAVHEGEHVALLGGEVEAEDVPGRVTGVGPFAGFDGDVAEQAGLGGVGDFGWGDAVGVRCYGGLGGGQGDDGGVAVDGVAGGLLGDDGVAVLLELAEDLLASEGAEIGGCAVEDAGAGVVDGREDKDGAADGGDGAGGEGRLGAETSGGGGAGVIGAWRRSGGVGSRFGRGRDEAARVEVGDVQERIVEGLGKIGGGRIWRLGESRQAEEQE